jgi:hypothetical protein
LEVGQLEEIPRVGEAERRLDPAAPSYPGEVDLGGRHEIVYFCQQLDRPPGLFVVPSLGETAPQGLSSIHEYIRRAFARLHASSCWTSDCSFLIQFQPRPVTFQRP